MWRLLSSFELTGSFEKLQTLNDKEPFKSSSVQKLVLWRSISLDDIPHKYHKPLYYPCYISKLFQPQQPPDSHEANTRPVEADGLLTSTVTQPLPNSAPTIPEVGSCLPRDNIPVSIRTRNNGEEEAIGNLRNVSKCRHSPKCLSHQPPGKWGSVVCVCTITNLI